MKLDYIKYAVDNVRHRKLRSWLTILSILIGIAAIYSLVSFGQGLSHYIDDISTQLGSDKLIVQAKSVGAPGTDLSFYIPSQDTSGFSYFVENESVVGTRQLYSLRKKPSDFRILYSYVISFNNDSIESFLLLFPVSF